MAFYNGEKTLWGILGATLILPLALCSTAWSIPALDRSWTITQPDGSSLEVKKFGNEHFHYTGTADGYPIRKDHKGAFNYIDENGNLTEIQATQDHSKDSEKNFRSKHSKESIWKSLRKKHKESTSAIPENASMAPFMGAASTTGNTVTGSAGPSKLPAIPKNFLIGEKKALIILVQFKDTKFISDDPQAEFDRIFNEEGYASDNSFGSVRDYFVQNSMGRFRPSFDVVGPITLSGNNYRTYGNYAQDGARRAVTEAFDSLIKQNTIDLSQYDNDGDRYIDFIHMIYAGFGAHDSDQDSAIWPHKWILARNKTIISRKLYAATYACSAERDGFSYMINRNSKKLAGVGNVLHEFSHMMGLPDLYPTNGDTTLYTPTNWSIMDAGAYNSTNYYGPVATSPPYYSAFERMSLGWLTPDDLYNNGSVKLASIDNNVALRLQNPSNPDEFFLMEQRSDSRWDSALPNHGMLIWHIDYKRSSWDSAAVNNTTHMHVDIEEADGIANERTASGDAFPGSSRIKSFNKFILWNNTDLQVALSNITESSDRTYISFDVAMDAPDGDVEIWLVPEEESSSSEAISSSAPESSSSKASSSSAVLESSSSVASSSSAISSSNEAVLSSSSTQVQSSSSEGTTLVVRNSTNINLHVSCEPTRLIITGLPQKATVSLFSVNGNLLYRKTFTGGTAEIDTRKFIGPILLKVR